MKWLHILLLFSTGLIHASDQFLIQRDMVHAYNALLQRIIQSPHPIQCAKNGIVTQAYTVVYMCNMFGNSFLNTVLTSCNPNEKGVIITALTKPQVSYKLRKALFKTLVKCSHIHMSLKEKEKLNTYFNFFSTYNKFNNLMNSIHEEPCQLPQDINKNAAVNTIKFLKGHAASTNHFCTMYTMQPYCNAIPQEWFNNTPFAVKKTKDKPKKEYNLLPLMHEQFTDNKELIKSPIQQNNTQTIPKRKIPFLITTKIETDIQKMNVIRAYCKLPQYHENGFLCWPLIEKYDCINQEGK